jgi:hypothetical protein
MLYLQTKCRTTRNLAITAFLITWEIRQWINSSLPTKRLLIQLTEMNQFGCKRVCCDLTLYSRRLKETFARFKVFTAVLWVQNFAILLHYFRWIFVVWQSAIFWKTWNFQQDSIHREDGGSKLFRNVGKYLQIDVMSHLWTMDKETTKRFVRNFYFKVLQNVLYNLLYTRVSQTIFIAWDVFETLQTAKTNSQE